MKKLSNKIIEFKEKGAKTISVSCNHHTFIFKQPDLMEISYHQDQIYKTDSVFRLRDKFIRQMFLGENTMDFDQFMKEKPLAHS
ncbi:MAG: hypothetical protein ACRCTJ_05455 [Brevinema sp.]